MPIYKCTKCTSKLYLDNKLKDAAEKLINANCISSSPSFNVCTGKMQIVTKDQENDTCRTN